MFSPAVPAHLFAYEQFARHSRVGEVDAGREPVELGANTLLPRQIYGGQTNNMSYFTSLWSYYCGT